MKEALIEYIQEGMTAKGFGRKELARELTRGIHRLGEFVGAMRAFDQMMDPANMDFYVGGDAQKICDVLQLDPHTFAALLEPICHSDGFFPYIEIITREPSYQAFSLPERNDLDAIAQAVFDSPMPFMFGSVNVSPMLAYSGFKDNPTWKLMSFQRRHRCLREGHQVVPHIGHTVYDFKKPYFFGERLEFDPMVLRPDGHILFTPGAVYEFEAGRRMR